MPISIHKALAGLDRVLSGPCGKRNSYFNPQGPRGPRPRSSSVKLQYVHFNPQGPRGPRQLKDYKAIQIDSISIHKALAGLDRRTVVMRNCILAFQSTRPSRASTMESLTTMMVQGFQSTRPSRASTTNTSARLSMITDFNPQGPRGPRP